MSHLVSRAQLIVICCLLLNVIFSGSSNGSNQSKGRVNRLQQNKQSNLFEEAVKDWPSFKREIEGEKDKVIEMIETEQLVKELSGFLTGRKKRSKRKATNKLWRQETEEEFDPMIEALAESEPIELEAWGRESAVQQEKEVALGYDTDKHSKEAKHIASLQERELISMSEQLEKLQELDKKRKDGKPLDQQQEKAQQLNEQQLNKLAGAEIPCLDGNCVDKSYASNGQMMDSLAKLKLANAIKDDGKQGSNLFAGQSMQCRVSGFGYNDCCRVDRSSWGKSLFGAQCYDEEKSLAKLRGKNLCVYVGSRTGSVFLVGSYRDEFYCCFGQQLDKTVQEQGRRQLGMSFGSSTCPNCRGLSLQEIGKLNWDRIDFSAVATELEVKFRQNNKLPKIKEFEQRIKDSLPAMDRQGGINRSASSK